MRKKSTKADQTKPDNKVKAILDKVEWELNMKLGKESSEMMTAEEMARRTI